MQHASLCAWRLGDNERARDLKVNIKSDFGYDILVLIQQILMWDLSLGTICTAVWNQTMSFHKEIRSRNNCQPCEWNIWLNPP